MKTTSNAEKQEIGMLWAELLEANTASFTAISLPPNFNPQTVFCKDWPLAKAVLQALQSVVPQPGPIIIGLVIAAGDAAHKKVCPINAGP